MYKLTTDPNVALRVADNTSFIRGSKLWDEFEAWLADGNTPDPAHTQDELDEIDRLEQERQQRSDDISDNLPSWNQVATSINNATTIPAMKAIILKLARIVYWLAKNQSS